MEAGVGRNIEGWRDSGGMEADGGREWKGYTLGPEVEVGGFSSLK